MHITRYSHHAVYYAYVTYLFYNWRFVFFNLLQPFHILPLSLPLVTAHLFFVLVSSFSFLVLAFFFFRYHIQVRSLHYLSFSV